MALVDEEVGSPKERYVYDVWGAIREVVDKSGEPTGAPWTRAGNPWAYCGWWFDFEEQTLLHSLRAYSSAIGRFHEAGSRGAAPPAGPNDLRQDGGKGGKKEGGSDKKKGDPDDPYEDEDPKGGDPPDISTTGEKKWRYRFQAQGTLKGMSKSIPKNCQDPHRFFYKSAAYADDRQPTKSDGYLSVKQLRDAITNDCGPSFAAHFKEALDRLWYWVQQSPGYSAGTYGQWKCKQGESKKTCRVDAEIIKGNDHFK